MLSVQDAEALLYLSRKSGDYSQIEASFPSVLSAWQQQFDTAARDVLLCWVQATAKVADPLFATLAEQLTRGESVEANLQLLTYCAKPATVCADVLQSLWAMLGSTEQPETAESVSHAIALLLPTFAASGQPDFPSWWPSIVQCVTRSENKKHVSAGLRAWMACMITLDPAETKKVVYSDSEVYFRLLQQTVSTASKYGLQVLNRTLDIADEPIACETITWDPAVSGARDAWSRYSSLCDILGIDTSMHQAEDALADFVVLLSDESPIPPLWGIALINVGLCASNSDGIKSLITDLILHLQPEQLSALVLFPEYLSHTMYARFLQTPSFVVLGGRCAHAENVEAFTRNMTTACLNRSEDAARDFVYQLGRYFMSKPHSYEAPRVLVVQSLLDTLPRHALGQRELAPLQNAAHAASLTYTSKAMADLFFDLCAQLACKCGPLGVSKGTDWSEVALTEADNDGFLRRETFEHLSRVKKVPSDLHEKAEIKPKDLLGAVLTLQLSAILGERMLDEDLVRSLLEHQLDSSRSANSEGRAKLNAAIGSGFDYIHEASADLCETAFMKFDSLYSRLAALRSFKRGIVSKVSTEFLGNLWNQIKEASLRIQDRELHHEFIELLTNPDLVKELSLDICFDIVEQSAQRKNLLVPLARGVARFEHGIAASLVMAKLFCFIRSEEHTVQLEELVAARYGVSEQNWGEPENFSRALAAHYLATHFEHSEETARYILEVAGLERLLSGSFDNVEARQRCLYYQALILQEKRWSHDFANEVLMEVKFSLEQEASPVSRVHAEWLIALITADHNNYECPEFVLAGLTGLQGSVHTPPRLIGSLIRIGLLVYFSENNPSASSLGEALVERLLPLATSNKAAVRHRCISALYIVSKAGKAPKHLQVVVDGIAEINEAGVQNSSYQNEAFVWPLHDLRLGPVCGGIACAVFDTTMGDTLLESDFAVLTDVDHGPCWSGKPVKLRKNDAPRLVAREGMIRDAVREATSDFSSHVQTKSAAADLESRAQRTSLIVVATLCDKPVNLGAITRLSDALGVSLLTVRDATVVSDAHFKSTALTAEKWIPMQEVSEAALGDFLRAKKAAGYALVGIEQTDTSLKLGPDLQFPEKTVLMMGHEKQGIPAELLALLDTCIEIEQLGYVRSMNIQTATAVVVHAYNHQRAAHAHKVTYIS